MICLGRRADGLGARGNLSPVPEFGGENADAGSLRGTLGPLRGGCIDIVCGAEGGEIAEIGDMDRRQRSLADSRNKTFVCPVRDVSSSEDEREERGQVERVPGYCSASTDRCAGPGRVCVHMFGPVPEVASRTCHGHSRTFYYDLGTAGPQ